MVLLSVCVTGSAFAADVFYETRLRAGRDALNAGKHLDAVENLRIACFGMLDAPRALSPCLAMLAMSQNGLGRPSDVDATLARFIEVETRFPSYDVTQLDPAVRRDFEALLQQRLPKSAVAALPAVNAALTGARLPDTRVASVPVRSEPPAVVENVTVTNTPAKPPASQPAPAIQKPATTASTQPAPAKPVEKPPSVQTPSVQTPAKPLEQKPIVQSSPTKPPVTKPAPAATKPAPAATRPASADPLGDARKLIADRRPGEAVKVLETAIVQAPQRRDLRLAHLQAAVFAGDWKSAAAQQQVLRPFRESEAAYAFYAAVSLFETGRRGEARDLLSPIMPRLARSAWVDDYAKRILSSK